MAAKKGKEIRERHASDRIFNAAVIILSITTFIVIAYPLWFIVIASISNSNMVNQGKVILWPVDIRFYDVFLWWSCSVVHDDQEHWFYWKQMDYDSDGTCQYL